MTITEILEYQLIPLEGYNITPLKLIYVLLIFVLSRLSLKWIQRFVQKSPMLIKKLDTGRRFALMQFVRYIIYVIAFLMMASAVGVNLSVIWAGSAALLVGVGLGLQQIFNDLASGVVLLLEGEIEVGDVVEVDGVVGKIKRISMRASHIETKDNVDMVVPNSRLITGNIINYGANLVQATRFRVSVGVAYGSDVQLVKKLLLKAAEEHPMVLKESKPVVFFTDFGNSSLDFDLIFFCREMLYVNRIKSDLRFRIDELFREHQIEIPFPQQDIWFRNAIQNNSK